MIAAASIGTGSCLNTDTLTITVTAAVAAGTMVHVVGGGGAVHTATADTSARVFDYADSRGNTYINATATKPVIGDQSSNGGSLGDADDLVIGASGLSMITTALQIGDTITVNFATGYPASFRGVAVATAITGVRDVGTSQFDFDGDFTAPVYATSITYPDWVTTPAVVSYRSAELPSQYQTGAGKPDATASLITAAVCWGRGGGVITGPIDATLVDGVTANGMALSVGFIDSVAAATLVDPGWNFDGNEDLAVVGYQFILPAAIRYHVVGFGAAKA